MNDSQNFNYFLNNQLNDHQQQAVTPKDGVLIVCAGAGSGKTRIITARITNLLLNHNVPYYSIVALTFTNKAAQEMKERVKSFLSHTTDIPFIGTFHSYCLRTLKTYGHLLSLNQFTLLDDSDQEKIVKQIITKHGLQKKISSRNALSAISRLKNEYSSDNSFDFIDPLLKEIYFAYEHEKQIARCLDFDDLLLKTLELFSNHSDFRAQFQRITRHVLVDEYQDTNRVQHALLKAMTQTDKTEFALDSLCVVGDEDQSIYSWRGATVSNIINFHQEFKDAKLITVEQNYRSVQPILKAANHIIQNNIQRNPKNLWSSQEGSNRISILQCSTGYQESEAIANFVNYFKSKNGQNGLTLYDCAILYRSHFQSRILEESLIRHSIPYKIVGGIQFYDRLEIKDMLAYLRLVINPFDRIAFSRIINTPTRGFGIKFEEQFYEIWENNPFSDFKGIADILIKDKLTDSKAEALKLFVDIFKDLESNLKPSEALNLILQKTSYFNYLQNSFDEEEFKTKKENVKEFVNGAIYFEQQNPESTLATFLEEITLFQEQMQKNTDENYIRLMTLHAAKGLEFHTVIIAGTEDGVLPSTHSTYNPEALEEERRLLYVGITRAKQFLMLSYARFRYMYGQPQDQRASRFLHELPEDLIQHYDCAHWRTEQFNNFFLSWLNNKQNRSNGPAYAKATARAVDVCSPCLSDEALAKIGSEAQRSRMGMSAKTEWYASQQILHPSFGKGIIQKVENTGTKIYLTIKFASGSKKIDAQFLKN